MISWHSCPGHSYIILIHSLQSLLFALVLAFYINDQLPSFEFSLDLGFWGKFSLHPRMSKNLFEFWSIVWVKCHHFFKEILELRWINILALFGFLMCLPKNVCTTCSNQAIMRVWGTSNSEWRSLRHYAKENYRRCKKIHAWACVRFS